MHADMMMKAVNVSVLCNLYDNLVLKPMSFV
jgi:hypothetical protein